MSSFDAVTLCFYASKAPDYHANSAEGINCDLPQFLDRLLPGAQILELGCGGGRDAAYMVSRGFMVEPTDGVPEMAAIAQRRLGRAIRVMRFDELEAIEEYDAVYASYSLLHVPRSGLASVIKRIWTALRPGGWHMATYKRGEDEGRDDLNRYFNYLSRDQAERYYCTACEWQLLALTHGEGPGYKGRRSPWINVIAQKPG